MKIVQLFNLLLECGFVHNSSLTSQNQEPFGGEALNRNSGFELIKSILCVGSNSNFALKVKKRIFQTKEEKVSVIHPSSVNHKKLLQGSPWFLFQEKLKTKRVFLLNISQVSFLFSFFLFVFLNSKK